MLFTQSRRCTVAAMIAMLAFVTFAADTASAKDLGHHDPGEIHKTCDAVGGKYYNVGVAYGCMKDGAGKTDNQRIVSCDNNNNCTGYCQKCPAVKGSGGTGVVGGAGTAGNASGTARAHAAPSHKIKPVVAVHHAPLKKFAARATRVH